MTFLTTGGGLYGEAASRRTGSMLPESPGMTESSITRDQFEALSMDSFNQVNKANVGMGAWEQVHRFTRAAATDTLDSIWSTPLNPFSERGDLWEMASGDQRRFYERNKPAIEGTSAVVGGIASAVFAEALLIPRIAGALASSTALTSTRMWQAGKQWKPEAMRNMLQAQKDAIRLGESPSTLTSWGGASLLANRAAVGAAAVTRTLPFDYAIMWNNEAFNSGEVATEAFWIATGGVLGGAAGAIASRGIARRSMNSPWARNELSKQVSQAGVTNSLLGTTALSQPKLPNQGNNTARLQEQLHLKDSTELTHWLIGSRSNLEGGMDVAPDVQNRASDLRQTSLAKARDTVAIIMGKGIAGVSKVVREKADSMLEVKYLTNEVAKNDPYVALGMDEFGLVDGSFSQAIKDRKAYGEKLFENADKQAVAAESIRDKKLAAKIKRQNVFAFADGTWHDPESPLVEAMRLHSDKEVMARTKLQGDSSVYRSMHMQGGEITIGSDLIPRRTGGRRVNVAGMDHRDRFALYKVADRTLRHRTSQVQKSISEIQDAKDTDWFALDMFDELFDMDPSMVKFSDKNTVMVDRPTLQRRSLQLKAQQLLNEVGELGDITAEIRLRYNLPAPTSMELLEDPAGDAFRVWLTHAARNEGTVDELAQALTSGRAAHGLDLLPTEESYRAAVKGRGVNFNRYDPTGKGGEKQWMRPMLATFEPRDVLTQIAKSGHEEQLIRQKVEMINVVSNPNKSPHIASAAKQFTSTPAMAAAHAVDQLTNAQSTGLGGRLSQAVSEFLPTRFKHRDNPIVLAASRLGEMVDRMGTAAYVKAVADSGLEAVLSKYSTHKGAALRAELDQFVSLRPGWDIKEVVEMGDGRFGFALDDTPVNRKLLEVAKVEEGAVLTNLRTGDAITLGEEAMKAMTGYWKGISDELYKGTNTLREANNQSPMARKKFHVPTVNTQGKRVGFLQGPDGQIVPGVAVVEATDQAFSRQSARLLAEYGDGYVIRNKEQIAATRDIWDLEAMDWVDHGASTALRGGKQEGGLTPGFVRDGSFLDMLDDAKAKYQVQHRDLLKSLMKHPLQIARMRSAVERQMAGTKGVGAGAKGTVQPDRNIFDEYEQALTGTSVSHRETGILAPMLEAIEDGIDASVSVSLRHVADIATQWGVKPGQMRAAKTHADIVKVLGEHSPYKSSVEWLESQGVRQPITVRKVSQKLNNLATNLVLRWDPAMAHASLNMLGLIPTILGTVKAGAAPSTMAITAKGKSIPMWDGIQIIKGGIADMTKVKRMGDGKLTNADWKKMVDNGDASQSSFEYHLMTGSVKSKAEWEQYAAKLDSMLAWASDGSENLSRQTAHFVGLRLARHQGIKNIDEAHDFAREFANAAIADYAPSNRPELYQTSLGSVFGLFQSYAINQFSKMYHWMEKGDYAAAGMQAATQATLFGLPGMYGANAIFGVHDKFFQDSGEPSLLDNLYNQFGPTVGNAIAHGGLAEITRVALWTRGDMQPRMPIISGGQLPPGVDVVKRFANMFTGSIAPFLKSLPQDALPAAIENIQREMPNRMMKGIIGIMQGGMETDRSGNIIHSNQSWLDSISRVAGVRSARQQLELTAFYAGKADMVRDANRREKVRTQFRTDVRKAARNGEQVDPMKYFDKYVESGGNPKSFRSWFKQIVRDSANPRALTDLRRNLENPRNRVALWRYGGYGAWDIDDMSSR